MWHYTAQPSKTCLLHSSFFSHMIAEYFMAVVSHISRSVVVEAAVGTTLHSLILSIKLNGIERPQEKTTTQFQHILNPGFLERSRSSTDFLWSLLMGPFWTAEEKLHVVKGRSLKFAARFISRRPCSKDAFAQLEAYLVVCEKYGSQIHYLFIQMRLPPLKGAP